MKPMNRTTVGAVASSFTFVKNTFSVARQQASSPLAKTSFSSLLNSFVIPLKYVAIRRGQTTRVKPMAKLNSALIVSSVMPS